MKPSAILASAAKATSYNMAVQLLIRLMTFTLNAIVLRYISRDLLGVANVRLTLLYTTVVFLTSDAFYRACLSRSEGRDWRQVINLMWCTVPVGALWATLLSLVWLYLLERPDPALVPYYSIGVVSYAASACLETPSDVLYVTAQTNLIVKLKSICLGLAQITKVTITATLVLWRPQWGLICFSIAQVTSSIILSATYFAYFTYHITKKVKEDGNAFPISSIRELFPSRIPGKPFLDRNLTRLTFSFFKQSFLKQILTEGERYVMTFFDVLSFADQGVYDVINNLGSMVARFIFMPIEESGYLFFSQMLMRGKPAKEQQQEALTFSSNILGMLLKIVTLIGCIILVFGYANSFLLLYIYGGEILSSGAGPSLLRWYCLYVLVIAVNGTTEGFVFAAMNIAQVDRYNKMMVVFSAVFLAASWYLTKRIGSVGFILANCLNMTARILHSVVFMKNYFADTKCQPLREIIPSVSVVILLIISLVLTAVSEVHFCLKGNVTGRIVHIGMSAVCLLAVVLTIYLTETKMVQLIREHFFQKKEPKTDSKTN